MSRHGAAALAAAPLLALAGPLAAQDSLLAELAQRLWWLLSRHRLPAGAQLGF